jgi:Zn-finger protein
MDVLDQELNDLNSHQVLESGCYNCYRVHSRKIRNEIIARLAAVRKFPIQSTCPFSVILVAKAILTSRVIEIE